MLVDAHLPLPQHALLAQRPFGQPLYSPESPTTLIAGASTCELFVLVSSACNLPEIPAAPAPDATPGQGAAAVMRRPSAFVALKAARDIVNGGAVQAATAVAANTCSPTWYATACASA
jgi:hypothetical protein